MIIRKKMFGIGAALSIIIMAAAAPLSARDALFLGLMDAAGKPVQQDMELAIRNALAASGEFRLVNHLETQRIIRERERQGRGGMELFVPPSAKLSDSTIVIRGVVEELVMELKRSWLAWGKIDARIMVKFYFCDLAGGSAYQGEFSASAAKKKEAVLFASPKKAIHVSATDRTELLGKMQSTIVKDIAKFASTYFNSLASDTEKQEGGAPAEPEPAVLRDGEGVSDTVSQ